MREVQGVVARLRVECVSREHHHRHRPLFHVVHYCDRVEYMDDGKRPTALLMEKGQSKPKTAVMVKDILSVSPITYITVKETKGT